jgi:DNA mismatch repair protein MutS2
LIEEEQHTRAALDWELLVEAMEEGCYTAMGRVCIREQVFAETPRAARILYQELEELQKCVNEECSPPFQGMPDIRMILEKAEKNQNLDVSDLLLVVQQLILIKEGKDWIEEHGDGVPKLVGRLEGIPMSSQFYFLMCNSFDHEGNFHRDTYPELYRRMEQRQKLQEQVQSLLQSLLITHASMLQENFYTKRNGRYVLPMKANYKRTAGIVHGRSHSAETFFVEPLPLVELSNRLSEAEAAIEQEQRRILLLLSRAVSDYVDDLWSSVYVLGGLDAISAKRMLGVRLKGVIPLIGEEGMISVSSLRHPILALQLPDVVSNDLMLSTEHPALIISGPNAGGKTISLKALGLVAWMVRSGIPIPAEEGARIDFFPDIYADIGDDQALSDGLSTFSGQLYKLKALLLNKSDCSLVLLDELGMGTDPAQGSALAQATVERLLDLGARVVVTTHFSRIKALSAVDERFVNMAAEFRNGAPTYRLYRGEVGESHALALAKEVGLPEDVILRSQQLLSGKERELGELLMELDRVRVQVEQREQALERVQKEQEKERNRLQKVIQDHETRKIEIEQEVRMQVRSKFAEKEEYVQELIKVLRAQPSLKKASDSIAELRNLQKEMVEVVEEEPLEQLQLVISEGDIVTHRTMGEEFVVRAVQKKNRFRLERNGLIMEAKHEDIIDVGRAKPNKKKQRPTRSSKKSKREKIKNDVCARGDWNTIDLRGKRLEESKDLCLQFFDHHLCSGDRIIFVLHGHGTGILKKGLRSWFPKQSIVLRWRAANPGEGGDAFSIVVLDDGL